MIAHPPCTFLARSAARWIYDDRYPNRVQDQNKAIEFVIKLYESSIPMVVIENPIGILSTKWKKPDQIIHPWMFGDAASKATCLWLKNLPKLNPTSIVSPEIHTTKLGKKYDKWWFDTCRIQNLEERRRVRSKTFDGIAYAMAEQWGGLRND